MDALAELIMDLNYLHLTELPEYAAGYRHLLSHQNENGSWGDPEHIAMLVKVILQVNPKYLPEVGQYLHTTEVTLNALTYPCRTTDRKSGLPATKSTAPASAASGACSPPDRR